MMKYTKDVLEKILMEIDTLEKIQGDQPDYPEDDIIAIKENAQGAISYIQDFDWERYAIDSKEGALIDAQEARND